MDAAKLARMANQISANMAYGPDRSKAVAGVADHLLRFWTPQMRAELAESRANGAVELTEVADLALAVALEPDAEPLKRDTGGDAG